MPKIQGQNCASSQIISLKHLAYIKLDEIEVNSRAPKGPTHIKNPKRALEIGAFWIFYMCGAFWGVGPPLYYHVEEAKITLLISRG